MPTRDEDIPSTLRRSPKKVRETYEKTLDSAHETYDSEERAHRTAWSAVKHVAEKKGDHWEPKDQKGPSDAQAGELGDVEAALLAPGVEQRLELVPGDRVGHRQERALAVARSLARCSARASSSLLIFERPSTRASRACA